MKTIPLMIPGGAYSEKFGNKGCTILGYAKSDLTDSGGTVKDAQKAWNDWVLPYIKDIAE